MGALYQLSYCGMKEIVYNMLVKSTYRKLVFILDINSNKAVCHYILSTDQQAVSELLKENRLHYTSDTKPWITRKLSGQHWTYFDPKEKKITDKKEIERLNKLVLPPARKDVRMCPSPNGHLQATGIDTKWRKQYRYHPKRIAARSETKFHRMKEFGETLPIIRKKVKAHLGEKSPTQEKVLAAAITIMDRTGIRIGNEIYEQLYWSFGLTTLRNRHAKVSGEKITFQFVGKKWVKQNIELKSKKLARIIKQCRDLPWHTLLEYIDESWEVKSLTSDLVNEYIKSLTDKDFTAKDFRTRHGTVYTLDVIHNNIINEEQLTIPRIIDAVAEELGNTRAVCKKYYIHPVVFELYENDGLVKYYEKHCNCEAQDRYEKMLCAILDKI